MTVTQEHAERPIDQDIVGESGSVADPNGPRVGWVRALAFGVLPVIAMILALCAGYAKWRSDTVRDAELAGIESVQAAMDGSVAILAYEPDTVERDLNVARDRLTGSFRDSYTSLINDIVIPGAREDNISAVADVPAAGLVSVDDNHAVVLVFLNQTTTIGNDPPTDASSSVRVTLDKVDGRWLISGFDPV
jgi:Mce-associated membrane protein